MKRLTLVTLLQQPTGFDAPYRGGFNDNAPSGQPAGFSRVGPSQAQAGPSWPEPLQVRLLHKPDKIALKKITTGLSRQGERQML